MASVVTSCFDCGHEGVLHVGQRATVEEVTCFGAFECERCGAAIHEDGRALPPRWREAILAQEGEWHLVIPDASGATTVLRVLKARLGLTMQEVRHLKGRLGGPVLSGTEAEMQHLRMGLDAAGEEALVVRRRP